MRKMISIICFMRKLVQRDIMNFGANLKLLRERIGLSQREIGEIIGVNDNLRIL